MAGEDQEEIQRAFWAIELVPGKEFTTSLAYDLHITSAVLPASAKDTGRSVVSLSFADAKDKVFSVVSLKLDSNESQSLDIELDEGSELTFTVSGKNPVHLSGYYAPDMGGPEGMYDSDDEELDSDELGDGEEMDDSEDDVDEDIDEEAMKKAQAILENNKRKAQQQNGAEAKKPKPETPQQPKQTPNKPQQNEGKKPQQQQQQQQQQKGQPQQKELQGGLKYTILKEGDGTVASNGRSVGVKYVGKLTKNGKVFDKCQGKPFFFKIGAQEVIKGWDLGVAGMKVGEKRQLVIPPQLAYGSSGAGRDIPPNSTLTFEVDLVIVK